MDACNKCKGRGVVDEGDPEIGSALFDCECREELAAVVWKAMGDEGYLFGSGEWSDAHDDDKAATIRIAGRAYDAIAKRAVPSGMSPNA